MRNEGFRAAQLKQRWALSDLYGYTLILIL